MTRISIAFLNTPFSSIPIEPHQPLADHLTVQNSPVLFGCRTGICGTCLVEVEGDIPPPTEEEGELLDVLAPDNPKARLACQIDVTGDVVIRAIAPKG